MEDTSIAELVRTTETTVFSEAELIDEIEQSMQEQEQEELILMAGHFMLFYDAVSSTLTPGIFEDISNNVLQKQVQERVGIFPSYTWDLGIRLGELYQSKYKQSAKLLLLINDWQYIPDQGKASDYRSEFYENFNGLPPTYAARLAQSKYLSANDMLPSRKHDVAFPETWLKYRFQKAATRLVKADKLQKKYLDDRPGQSEVLFTDSTGESLPLISCGVTGCAGEVTEMISEVYKAGGRYLVLFAPSECHQPVRTGVEIALSLYELSDMTVLVADTGGNGEMTPEDIYAQGVNLISFKS